ncbi:coagulation factor V isoform X2 [Hemicordylus capensis]|uniref:coagulation factor V isoform X2 n=1 Tax=Hemicordylus capensis TaxID=884348 RepID=UPI0023037BBB|nr:coagulation factor V isoform X2 [Hemicordylus capensis]
MSQTGVLVQDAETKHTWSGSSYSDRTSPIERLDDAVPSGQEYTYMWEITAESGPKKADPPCLTYAYYSHVNMVQDFNSGLIGALLICKEGSLNEDGTQKSFDREYVLMFAVFDESKSWQKVNSLMYTINGYANGTLPDVQACRFDHISWHLIGMSSAPEIFSIHFNGQTLEQNHYRVSTVNLVGGASATANMSVSQTGKWLISSLVQKHWQAGMHGYLNIEDCGNPDRLTRKLSYKEMRMINTWNYFIAAEEIIWDYAPETSESIDSQYKGQHLDNLSNLIGKKYKKAVFRAYQDASFSNLIETDRPKERGILGPVIRAEVRDKINITFKNMASRPYSIYIHGVTLPKKAEGAVYPSDSKENSTQGRAVQPGETFTYMWTVRDTDEPTAQDSQCVTRLYHSAVDVTRDIASGLIGPLLICKRRSLNKKGIQNKADVEQHAVFAVFDENKSWYLEDNIREYCRNPSAVKRDDPKFYKSNVMHTLNGYVSERKEILGFCQHEIVEWHLNSVGTQDEIVPVYLSGHTFLSRGKHQDVLNLFPMSGESTTVTMDNIGTWLLASWDSHEMSHGMRLKFRDVKCDNDYSDVGDDNYYDDVNYDFASTRSEKPPKMESAKVEREKEETGTDVYDDDQESLGGEGANGGKGISEEDMDYQASLASELGLRTFKGPVAEEEELNLTALIMQDTYNISSVSDNNVTENSDLVFTNTTDIVHGIKVLETQTTTSYPNYTSLTEEILISGITTAASTLSSEQQQSDHEGSANHISDIYSQTLEDDSLTTHGGVWSKEREELLFDGEDVIFTVPDSEREQEESAGGEDTLEEKHEKHVVSEAVLHALIVMRALLFHVQQKRNQSALGNITSDLAFLSFPSAVNISSLDSDYLNYYEEVNKEANTTFSMLLTNLTLTAGETAGNSGFELELSDVQKQGNLNFSSVLDILVSILFPKIDKKRLKNSLHKGQKCPSKKAWNEWNFVSEKENYGIGADLTQAVDNKLQNNSSNTTMNPENIKFSSKKKQETYKGDSQLELGQPEMSNKFEDLNETRNENCTVSKSGTFLKLRRKNKHVDVLTPRTHRPDVSPRGFKSTQGSIKGSDHTVLLNETEIQNQNIPFVKIGFPSEQGDYYEYVIENLSGEQSSSDSFAYQTVHYDNPYTTDSRLDTSTVRNPDDIAERYLRTFSQGNVRRYYIAAVEVSWDYAAFRKSGSASSKYTKVVFRSYLDEAFTKPEVRGEYEEHFGILGPVIRAEVDDVIQVEFKNLASRPYSLHAHGLSYEKSSEGRSYDDESPEWFKRDDAINPKGRYTYVWHATKRAGPSQNQRACRLWAYYSAVNPEKDIHSGLIGPILICQKGMLDMYRRPIDLREFVLLFMVFDEEKSWYFNKHAKKNWAEKTLGVQRHHTFPAINGIPYHLPGLQMYKNEEVHWHMLNMGGPKDIHVVHFHGQTFTEQEMKEHQLGVYPLLPGSFRTVEMKPPKAGIWLLDTEVGDYQEAGMQAPFTVIDEGCKLPMGLASGSIQDSQISASDYTSYWEPKLARLNNSGKYNAWSTVKKENEDPWIQVDLQREVVITGIQTQGARQSLSSLYTQKYAISHSRNGRRWIPYRGNPTGAQKLFEGNSDAREIKENHIDPPIITRYIRVYPFESYGRPTLRMELLGCEIEGCSESLGMESGAIQDAQITASSYKKNWFSAWGPHLARLNRKGRMNAWQAKSNNKNQWLQIDLLQSKKITAIATQGARSLSTEMFVKAFSICYSEDGSTWKSYLDDLTSMDKVFTGNINSSSQIKHVFSPPIFSRFIRIIPKDWNQSICLRIELFGCNVI